MTKVRHSRRARGRVASTQLLDNPTNRSADTPPPAGHASTIERHAIDIAIWGLPLVGVDALRQAFFHAGATTGDVVYCSSPADSRLQIKAPDPASIPILFTFNLTNGPWVLQLPPFQYVSVSGSINDAWQSPLIEIGGGDIDGEHGARVLLLPAEHPWEIPSGYTPVWCATNNGYGVLRVRSAAGARDAVEFVEGVKLFAFDSIDAPQSRRPIDVAGRSFDTISPFDERWFEALARMVREERVEPRDVLAHGWLRAIGIDACGKRDFAPDAELLAVLRRAARDAHDVLIEASGVLVPYWPNLSWGTPEAAAVGTRTKFSFEEREWLDVDARAAFFFTHGEPPTALDTTLKLIAATDADGSRFDGGASYVLRVPPDVPATDGWSLTIYDAETSAYHRGVDRVCVDSRDGLMSDADGSATVLVGPKSSVGDEGNVIHSIPGRRWSASFRAYGAAAPLRDRTWVLPDFEIARRRPRDDSRRPRRKG